MDEFFNTLSEAANKLEDTKGVIRIISHSDCDGIAAAALLVNALKRLEKKFVVSSVKNLTFDVLKEISLEEYHTVVFLDLGSGSLESISKILKDKQVFILDHHQLQKYSFNGILINPLLFGIDGGTNISAAGVVYLLTKILDPANKKKAYLAIVGAIGDVQEKKEFVGLNKMILSDAQDMLEVKEGLRVFGSQTRSLHKVLEYSTDIFIPGVTGNERGAINFLQKLDIPLQDKNNKYRKLVNLSKEEMKRLIESIILERMKSEKNAEDVLGNIYLLKNENDDDVTRDLREFSTLLNATARLNKSSIGIGICLNDKKTKEMAFEILNNYKFEIINSLNWFHDNRKTEKVIELENLTIINAEEYIKDTLIGTIASIISKSNIYKSGTFIIAMAHTIDGFTKISARLAGTGNGVNLREILLNIINKIGGETGGHNYAAGALILQEKDNEFIEHVKEYDKKIQQLT